MIWNNVIKSVYLFVYAFYINKALKQLKNV